MLLNENKLTLEIHHVHISTAEHIESQLNTFLILQIYHYFEELLKILYRFEIKASIVKKDALGEIEP